MSSVLDLVVVVPVYNTMPDLRACLDSLVNQDLANERYEIVAVDDGSTDGGGDLLDEYAARHPNLRVIHQENSGWPGQPRNRALEASDSRYVFFADADDKLGSESLRRQLEFADQHGCDVVVPMLLNRPGERRRSALWSRNEVDADRALVFKTLSPQKLFRRDFLDKHQLRFPEGVVPLEDGLVLARAYLLAERVSVLADYEYYYKAPRQEGGNISMRGKPPAPFIDSVTKIIDMVREHAPDAETADRIVLDIYRRKALKYLAADRFIRYGQTKRRAWVEAIGGLTRSRISTDLESRLPADAVLRSQVARLGDVEAALALAEAANAGTIPARIDGARVTTRLPSHPDAEAVDITDILPIQGNVVGARTVRGDFELELDISTAPFVLDAAWELVAHPRHGDGSADVVVPLRTTDRAGGKGGTRAVGSLPAARLAGRPQRWDVCVRPSTALGSTANEGRLTLRDGAERGFIDRRVRSVQPAVTPYLTVRGNLSFRTGMDSPGNQLNRARLRVGEIVRSVTEPPLRRRVLRALPARQRKRARSLAKRVRQVRQSPDTGRELLAALGINIRGAGKDTVVVSRKRRLDVTNIDAESAIVTSRSGAAKVSVYETHKALFERMVTEHVVDMFHAYGVNCVLDVGANKGQYARKLRKAGYQGHIISFEPVPETFEHLRKAARNDPKWSVQHCALGDTDGTMPMHVVAGTMSSLLPASEYGGRRYKRFRNENVVEVPVRRLEQLLADILPTDLATPRLYLKLDTQGYDLEAFAGLGERTRDVVAMQSEVALLQIYEGMPRLPQAIETYEAAGFEITGMFPVTREKDTLRVLEFDCVLARADARR